jgi:hypothetical protein
MCFWSFVRGKIINQEGKELIRELANKYHM